MRRIGWALILVLGFSGIASALSIGGSGDFVGGWLEQLNIEAKADLGVFRTELSVEFGVPGTRIEQLMIEATMEPADVYVTFELARISQKPVDEVVEVYKVNKTKGWGALAKELGIKPGSAEFKALKDGNTAKVKTKKAK
ncbi:MAG: hypothetical protein GX986_05460 [Firmicutes bacterium]|nr:hypothetical protein [Bacillota bacterium]